MRSGGAVRTLFDLIVKPPYAFARDRIAEALDRHAGIRTEGQFTLDELGISGAHQVHYKPSNWLVLRRILPPRQVTANDVFVDFGSGMGRVVYQAARNYPFRRVIGVELSERMHAIAIDNIERNRHRFGHCDVRLVRCDAREFAIPDDVTIVYLNNPFSGPIFAYVVESLLASVERSPRRLRIIYFNPVEERLLLDAGFRVVKVIGGLRPSTEWSRANSARLYEISA
ncbi:MAG TPA: class I SAM-dependent methyltransferase [Solirubrobacteraceae bacterium]|nr:class I SAM-dependent methyltransferase [Solirubrobacteraceae bacterium]